MVVRGAQAAILLAGRVPRVTDIPSGAKQAAEKLNFSKGAKNGSRQDALGTIREGWLMVLHPPNFALSLSIRSFSAACKALADSARFAARLKPCPFKTDKRQSVWRTPLVKQ